MATPLMIACGLSKNTPEKPEQLAVAKQCVSDFLELGADVLATDNDRWTALHWAAFHNCPEAAKALLLEEGVVGSERIREDLFRKTDAEGKTALDVAEEEKSAEVVKYLKLFENRLAATAGATAASGGDLKQRKPAAEADIAAVD